MASYRINFTKEALLNAKSAPAGKRDYYYDKKEPGLVLVVTDKDAKSFYLYKRVKGKPSRIRLGNLNDLSIESARKIAAVKKGEIAEGKDPAEERRVIRSEMTLGQLFIEYMNRYSKVHKRSWKYDEREIPKYLSHWFNRKISSITREEVRKLHEKITLTYVT